MHKYRTKHPRQQRQKSKVLTDAKDSLSQTKVTHNDILIARDRGNNDEFSHSPAEKKEMEGSHKNIEHKDGEPVEKLKQDMGNLALKHLFLWSKST